MQIGLYTPRPSVGEQLREAVEELDQSACLGLAIRCCDSYESLLQETASLPLDVLVYDMESSLDARDELIRLAQTIPNCRIVLLSDSERHAVFGYSLRAAGYLTTPLDKEEFLSILICLLREQIKLKEQFLPIRINGVWSRLPAEHVAYVESAGHSLLFHMDDKRTFKIQSGFKEYQNLLDLNTDFFRCHKSYVVNMGHVRDWSLTAFLLKDGSEINISRPYRRAARSMYACYVTKPIQKEAAQAGGPRL